MSTKPSTGNDMMDKIRDLLDKAGADTSSFDEQEVKDPEADPIPPLEEIMAAALYSLEEIRLYGTYGRTEECVREATEALENIKRLQTKWIEQNQIMDALTKPAEQHMGGYA